MNSPESLSTGACRFADDLRFLRQHTEVVVLHNAHGAAQVAVAPALQARVMTSSAAGEDGSSFGWINRAYFDEFAAGRINPHMSPFGGEDRFWLGPEGGQFAIFFTRGQPFEFANWRTPSFLDIEPFQTLSTSATEATFARRASFANYSGTPFDIDIRRSVRLLRMDQAWEKLSLPAQSNASIVAFETDNAVTNCGSKPWSKSSGLLSIWILGMFNASPHATVAIPIKPGDANRLGKAVNDEYFGAVPPERLIVRDGVVFFKSDGKFRSKIGISPARTVPVMGSYDPAANLLTVVQFTFDPSARDYVNSAWQQQENPYGGDVANSYNDGPPPAGGTQMGQFYELESSSAARELKSGESLRHVHRTIHIQGEDAALEPAARAALGVGLHQIRTSLAR